MRRIIQVSAVSVSALSVTIYALCDDGTLWYAVHRGGKPEWQPMTGIPQGKIVEEDRNHYEKSI